MYTTKIDTLMESVRKLTRRGAYQNVRKILEKLHAADVAYLFRYLNENEQRKVLGLIEDMEFASDVLSQLEPSTAAALLVRMERQAAEVILRHSFFSTMRTPPGA